MFYIYCYVSQKERVGVIRMKSILFFSVVVFLSLETVKSQNVPKDCSSMNCFVAACDYAECPNFPEATCVGICNSCIATWKYKGRDVTKQC
uniref:Uncharacterized protein n=1 Tax=Magallana gigas TaxID=29159 RepID=A0A8W8LSY3_MAGGI